LVTKPFELIEARQLDFELQCCSVVGTRERHENAGIQPALASGLGLLPMQSRAR
jgi:hypothetical protein